MTIYPDEAEQVALRERIVQLIPEWSNREIGSFEFLPGGYSNHNYRFTILRDGAVRAGAMEPLERYVLRIPLAASAHIDRHQEAEFYQRFNQSGDKSKVPPVRALDPQSGLMISRWLDGPLLVDEGTTPDAIVDYLKTLHQELPVTERRYDPLGITSQFLSLGQADSDVVQMLDALTWQPSVLAPCHNDLNPWNVIVAKPDQWVTLDWEWFGSNDPLFDLITLHQGLGWDQAQLPEIAGEFREEVVPDAYLQDCLRAFWLREYAWAHAALCSGNDREEIATQKREARARLRAL